MAFEGLDLLLVAWYRNPQSSPKRLLLQEVIYYLHRAETYNLTRYSKFTRHVTVRSPAYSPLHFTFYREMDPSTHRRRRAQPQPQSSPLNIPNLPNSSPFPNIFVEPTETANHVISSPIRVDSKIAIPRLQRLGQNQPSPTSERQRVSHACDPCRKRKSKCDGLRPVCSRCRDQEVTCVYLDGKREKLKRSVQLPLWKFNVPPNFGFLFVVNSHGLLTPIHLFASIMLN